MPGSTRRTSRLRRRRRSRPGSRRELRYAAFLHVSRTSWEPELPLAPRWAFGAGGYFLVAYPLCACLLGIAAGINKRDLHALLRTARITLLRFLVVIPVAWLLMVAMWPWAWSAPIVAPLVAMKFASRFPFTGTTLFRGELLKATAVPASYLPTWFAITTPEFYFVAFALGLGRVRHPTSHHGAGRRSRIGDHRLGDRTADRSGA